MTAPTIDLNADLGELEELWAGGTEAALLELVTSANVACGGHAGDAASMRRTAGLALELGVAVGAHPSYPDRAGFGRQPMPLAPDAVAAAVAAQTRELAAVVAGLGGRLRHLKPHGALYHDAAHRPEIARAVAAGADAVAGEVAGRLVLVGLAGSPGLVLWRELGHPTAAEGFVDRRYEADGNLRRRDQAGALLTDPWDAAEQAVRLARGEGALALGGAVVPVACTTLCVHSDTPGAVGIARGVRAALERAGVTVAATV